MRDVGVYRGLTDVALRDAINAGEVEGPRMFVAGGYITTPGGGGEHRRARRRTFRCPKPSASARSQRHEARDRARYLLDHGADFIKLIATGAVLALGSEPGALELSPRRCRRRATRRSCAALTASPMPMARRGSRRRSAPAPGPSSMRAISTRKGIALAKAKGVWLDMDIYNGDWIEDVGTKQGWPAEYLRKNRETTDVQRAGLCRGGQGRRQVHVRHRCGGLSVRPGARQFAYMVRYGMTPMQAIQSATVEAARALGKEGQMGTLAPGAFGNLIAVTADPLADIRALERVEAVIKGGKLVN